jgi:Rrf2 family iron-sulfur cluster assembly transcriptional regulator
MVDFLDSVSLQDLVDQQRMRQLQEANKANASGVRVNVVGGQAATLAAGKQPAPATV